MVNTVLVATEDHGLSQQLRQALEAEEMTVLRAGTANEALAILENHQCDLTILQFNLPGNACNELAQICRQHTRAVILLLDMAAVNGVEAEALAHGLHGMAEHGESGVGTEHAPLRVLDDEHDATQKGRSLRCLTLGDLTLYLDRHHVTVASHSASLTPVQTRILQVLMEHSPRIISLELLAERVWPGGEGTISELASAVGSLRTILGADPSGGSRIRHLSGYGLTISHPPEP